MSSYNQQNKEQILLWAQEFCANKLKCPRSDLQYHMSNEQLKLYTPLVNKEPLPGLIEITTLGNPGWSLRFTYKDTVYKDNNWTNVSINCGANLIEQESDDWFNADKNINVFDVRSGPLYLGISFEAIRCFIERSDFKALDLKSFRENFKIKNSLISWLEEFYFSCCDGDWESQAGCSIIGSPSGWIVVISLDDLDLQDSDFEDIRIEDGGIIECYKLEDKFIIRSHPRGLIDGLTIFKKWVEVERSKNASHNSK